VASPLGLLLDRAALPISPVNGAPWRRNKLFLEKVLKKCSDLLWGVSLAGKQARQVWLTLAHAADHATGVEKGEALAPIPTN
jgi:hypothetical protein